METRHDTGSSAPLYSVDNAEDREDLHKIPVNLSARERLMLQTTQADEERGAVRVIKCRLCPKPRFSMRVTFQCHCKSCEKHLSDLRFCPKCGDYFGRADSGIRHKDKKHQEACLNTSQDEAREKRQKVERLLEAFEARLKHCLRSGEDIGPRFSDVMTKKLTNTSKKVSKTEEIWSEGDTWAAGLCQQSYVYLFFSSFRQSYRVRLRYSATDDGVVSSVIYILFLFLPGVVLYIFCSVDVL